MTIKHLAIGLAFLALAGCGCGDDGGGTSPGVNQPQFLLGIIPDCEFECPPPPPEACLIDVVFALDDSEFMTRPFGMTAGLPRQADSRSRSVVAQRIFADVKNRLLAKIGEAKAAGLIPADTEFDLAFSVVRYEDFGGSTVPYQGQPGTIDAEARPYMLQMPLLRQLHPQFEALFNAALVESTLPNGNPIVTPGAPPFQDPQSAIEMLHQVATGAGIDGNGANGTIDNGPPCSPTAIGSGPTPGAFVDVPAVTYQQNGNDPQDATRPIYLVQDENGNGVETCIASGNEGGVGFRPNSLRWVIFASDIATVAPFRDNAGNPADPANNQEAGIVETTAQRPAGTATIFAPAFDGVTGRYGAAGGQPNPPVGTATFSPAYAAGVEQTMNELVNNGIEVMALGAGGAQPGQTKPNVNPAVPDVSEPAITFPNNPDFTPFTMQSAISILTGSEVFDGTATNQDNDPNVGTGPWPAVYNLGNVGELTAGADPLVPTMGATLVNDTLIDDLVERIVDRVANKELGSGEGERDCPALPEMTVRLTVTVNDALADGTTNYQRAPLGNPNGLYSVDVTIPSYYRDAVTNETFQVTAGGDRIPYVPGSTRFELADISYLLRNEDLLQGNAPLPIDMLSFTVTAIELGVSNDTPENAVKVSLLREKLPTSLAGAGQISVQAQRTPGTPAATRSVILLPGASSGSCMYFQETTVFFGPFAEEQFGAGCLLVP